MPSAVASKVANILSKYNRPHSAASHRSSSFARSSSLRLNQSADFSHTKFTTDSDDAPSSSSHHRSSSLKPRPPARSRRDDDYSDEFEEEAPRPSSSTRSKVRKDEWEDEMMDEFGLEEENELHSAPIKKLPFASSHTRSISAPASKRGPPLKSRGVTPAKTKNEEREEEEEEVEVDFEEEELLIADSPAHKPQPVLAKKPQVTKAPVVEDEDEVYSEEEVVVAAPPPRVLPVVSAPVAVPVKRVEEVKLVVEEEGWIEEEGDEKVVVPKVQVNKMEDYEDDFEEMKPTPRPMEEKKADKVERVEKVDKVEKVERVERVEVVQVKKDPVKEVKVEQREERLPEVKEAVKPQPEKVKVKVEEQEKQEAKQVTKNSKEGYSSCSSSSTSASSSSSSRSHRRRQRYIHVTAISTQTEVSHNPLVQTHPGLAHASFHPAMPSYPSPYPMQGMWPQPFLPTPAMYYPSHPPPPSHYSHPYPYPAFPPPFPSSYPPHPYSSVYSSPAPSHAVDPRWAQLAFPSYLAPPPPVPSVSMTNPSYPPAPLPLSCPPPPPPPAAPAAASVPPPAHRPTSFTSPIPIPTVSEHEATVSQAAEQGQHDEEEKEAETINQSVGTEPSTPPPRSPPLRSLFHSGPVTVSHFISSSPFTPLTSAFAPIQPSACHSCTPLQSPSPLFYSPSSPLSSTSSSSLLSTRRVSSSPSFVFSHCDRLFPISSGLNPTDANVAFRHQLTALRTSLNTYRSALQLASL